MDIRMTSYSSTFGGTNLTHSQNGRASQYTVQNAASSGPVNPVAPARAAESQAASPTLDRIAGGDNGGYTDSVRGSLVNILA
jgi:hypothetical protein